MTVNIQIPIKNSTIRTIYLAQVSNETCMCIAFKKGCEGAQELARTLLCPDILEHNTLIGYMPPIPHILDRRCVCTILSPDAKPLLEKVLSVIARIGSQEKTHFVDVVPLLNLFDRPYKRPVVNVSEDHGS